MQTHRHRHIAWGLLLLGPVLAAQTQSDAPRYLVPPQRIVEAFDAKPMPQVILSPARTTIALTSRKANPSIAELARPMLRLAGSRINPKTNGPHRSTGMPGNGIFAISLKRIADRAEVAVAVPPQSNIAYVHFSPDGSRLSFTNTTESSIELWVADTSTGKSRRISGSERLNGAAGDPCEWLRDNVTLLCRTVPVDRGAPPVEPSVPIGPTVHGSSGKAAPAPTFEDLLKSPYDDELFDYYFRSQLAAFDVTSGRKTTIGRAGLHVAAEASPSGQFLLVTTVKRPFSHLVPMNEFPEEIAVWNRRGEVVRPIADLPSAEGLVRDGVRTGPRGTHWEPDRPAAAVWVEALDGGDPHNKAPFRDHLLRLEAPFTGSNGTPSELAKTEYRFASVSFTDKGVALVRESDRATRRTRTWIVEPGAEPRKLWDRREEARYDDPGTPVTRSAAGGGPGTAAGGRAGGSASSVIQTGDSIYLIGNGASPDGDRPFLDRLNLKTLKSDRLFRSEPKTFEAIVAPLSDAATTILTRLETPTDPPNYYVRDLSTTGASNRRAITSFPDPQPQLRGATHEFITYERKDGVKLSGTLYLPPGYQRGTRLPLIIWAYPREFTNADVAGEVTGSPYRFTIVTGASHLFLLLDGYAVLDDATMPIIGPGETANDTYVEQLVANAEAAIDRVVDMGVADRNRVGVGGHSYGAFMTANLLAHSRLFKAGFAESGAYNRTLTPFGFQNERRTFWQAPDLYAKLSPFNYADKIKDPILLTHGEADDNSGTFPIQSERLYMALKGHGATVRYLTLPFEAHGYAARETLLDVIAEKINWFGKYVKGDRSMTTAGDRR